MRYNHSTQFRHRQLPAFLLSLLLLFPFPAIHAATLPKENMEEIPSIESIENFDSYRDTASRQVTRFANWIDNFFADDRIYDENQGSYIKLNLLQTYFEDYEPAYEAEIKAKLDLPKTQGKLQLLIESDDEDEENSQKSSITEAVEKQEQSVALRYIRNITKELQITNIAGVRWHSGIDPFVRFRIRRFIDKGLWSYRITESLFWFNSEGAGETTRLDIDHTLTKNLLFRSTTEATWRNINNYFDLGQDLILFQNINKRKSIAYQAGTRGISEPNTHATNHFLLLRYRQQLHNKWLFLEVIPAINHPIENDYKPIRSITLKFEIVFDAK